MDEPQIANYVTIHQMFHHPEWVKGELVLEEVETLNALHPRPTPFVAGILIGQLLGTSLDYPPRILETVGRFSRVVFNYGGGGINEIVLGFHPDAVPFNRAARDFTQAANHLGAANPDWQPLMREWARPVILALNWADAYLVEAEFVVAWALGIITYGKDFWRKQICE